MISLILLTKNRLPFLKRALASILNQHDVEKEILIMDDQSSDGTIAYLKQLQHPSVRVYFNTTKASIYALRKRLYGYARGEYVVFMDDDDYYLDLTLFHKVETIMAKYPNVASVLAGVKKVGQGTTGEGFDFGINGLDTKGSYLNGFRSLYPKPYSSLTCFLRKERLEKMGFLEFEMYNDASIILFGLLCGDVYILNTVCAAYQIHKTNITRQRFSLSFMRDCLHSMNVLYALAKDNHRLQSPSFWYQTQIQQTLQYFLQEHWRYPRCIAYLIWWGIHHYALTSYACKKVYFNTIVRRYTKGMRHVLKPK